MTKLATLMVFSLVAVGIRGSPTASTAEQGSLEKRKICGVKAGVEYYPGIACNGGALVHIPWGNKWSSYNYQRTDARSFTITDSDWNDVQCNLYDGDNATGRVLSTLSFYYGNRVCVSRADGGNVKSIKCWGNRCP